MLSFRSFLSFGAGWMFGWRLRRGWKIPPKSALKIHPAPSALGGFLAGASGAGWKNPPCRVEKKTLEDDIVLQTPAKAGLAPRVNLVIINSSPCDPLMLKTHNQLYRMISKTHQDISK